MAKKSAKGNGQASGGAKAEQPAVRRDILPIPDPQHVGLTTYDAKDPNTKYPPITELRPPDGAPNVLIVLIDDVGFGASSAFGGPCNTPTAERLAAGSDPPWVVLISSREAAAYGPRLEAAAARGFIPKRELSGSALAALVG